MGFVSPRRRRSACKGKFKSLGDHEKFLARIKKSLYYGRLPSTERLSLPVTELATELFSAAQRNHSLKRLELEEASAVSRSACVSPCSLVLALLYIERLQTCQPSYLQDTNPSELYLVSLMVATKFLQDDGEDDGVVNEEWASSAGITTSYLNYLERNFLNAIEWEVYVNEKTFWTKLRGLERDVALNEGVRRGWFSYADLDVLFEKFDYASVAHTVLSVSAVCLTSYTASVLTLIASTLFVSQLQLLVSSLGGMNQTGAAVPTVPVVVPFTSLDQSTASKPTDIASQPHQPAMDILTTSFILASISKYNEIQKNDSSPECSEPIIQSSFFIKSPLLERSYSLSEKVDFKLFSGIGNGSWNSCESSSWLSWFKGFGLWLEIYLVRNWISPPAWASPPSHLIPIHVY